MGTRGVGQWFGLLARLRGRRVVTERLRELSPLHRWRGRNLLDLLGLDLAALVQALKVALSAGVSWALAQWLLDSPSPIWAPLTAALTAMLTVSATVKDAMQRVFAVVLGMAVALWVGSAVGLHAWSIAAIVGLGVLAGKVFRLLPAAAAQIPVNGLFILALGSGENLQRVLDTLIGAVVAIAVNLLILPPNHVNQARRAVGDLAEHIVDLVSDMAAGIQLTWRLDQAADWLHRARGNATGSSTADTAVQQAVDSMRLHPKRSNWQSGLHRLQLANRTLHTVEILVRVVARTMRDIAEDVPAANGTQPALPMSADMLTTLAGAISAFASEMLSAEPELDPDKSTTRAAIGRGRTSMEAITADLQDMMATNRSRGIYLVTLVVETGRVLDELEIGLNAAGRPDEPPPAREEISGLL